MPEPQEEIQIPKTEDELMNFDELNERLAEVTIEDPNEAEAQDAQAILKQAAYQAGRYQGVLTKLAPEPEVRLSRHQREEQEPLPAVQLPQGVY